MAIIEAEVPVAMRAVCRRLVRWRSKRKGRARIPEPLWAAAGELLGNMESIKWRECSVWSSIISNGWRNRIGGRQARHGAAGICGTDRTTNSRRADVHHRVGRAARHHANRVEGNDHGPGHFQPWFMGMIA